MLEKSFCHIFMDEKLRNPTATGLMRPDGLPCGKSQVLRHVDAAFSRASWSRIS